MPLKLLDLFLKSEATAGLLVMAAAALALLINNSPLSWAYDGFFAAPVSVRVGPLYLDKTILLLINDGLMAVFFLLVGLEIKREIRDGDLSSREAAALPLAAAIGGMVMPAIIYAAINWGNATALRGWAIPTATDIAFALGVLALLGPRVPASLKVFLLAFAIIDDLGAIVIIALFYTADLSTLALGLATLALVALALLNRLGVTRLAPYVVIGVLLWLCVLKSGVHATLAGVALALAIPMVPRAAQADEGAGSLLHDLEHRLHPWVTYLILPLFAFANAGVSLAGSSFSALLAPVPLGILLGLCLGKPIGITAACWLAIRSGYCRLPEGSSWPQLIGVAMLGGVGFTMSLFIGMLAFSGDAAAVSVRLGVLTASILSAIAGYSVLRAFSGDHKSP